ncbi:helix-turn-helix domain-containing protein [Streptomyces sp. NPDC014894]|uniref:helix-turn-helix domain-containing protein n=1 Tax=Streptomyces sp. NPDC014894 TaxID=3364931 RepID=UPI0036FEDB8E
MLSQKEAAAVCAVSLSTIRRRRENGGFPGARQDPARGWLIPAEDLSAAGLPVQTSAPAAERPRAEREAREPDSPADPDGPVTAMTVAGPGSPSPSIDQLGQELADARLQRHLAEAEVRALNTRLAAQQEHLDDLRRLLFGGAPGWGFAPVPAGAVSDALPPSAARRWAWRRWSWRGLGR